MQIIHSRVLNDEDKQFKQDIEDIIAEHIQQVFQYLNPEEETGADIADGNKKLKAIGNSHFLGGLTDYEGIEQKNLLLEVLNRQLTGKGNYLNMDGQSLSIKDYLKDWDTDNLFATLYPDGDFEYVYRFQS